METSDKIVLGLGGAAIVAAVVAAKRSSDTPASAPATGSTPPPSNPAPVSAPSIRTNVLPGLLRAHPLAAQLTGTSAPTLDEAWYQETLNRLRAKLDALGAAPSDDQYWRAVFFLNHARSSSGGFSAPSSLDRFNALKLVSDLVFAIPIRGAGNVIQLRSAEEARVLDFLRSSRLSPAQWLALSPQQKRAALLRVRPASVERVIASIDAFAIRQRPSRLRPAGDATSTTQDTPWGLLVLFGVGFAGLEWMRRGFDRGRTRRNPDTLASLHRRRDELQRAVNEYRLSGRLGAVRDTSAELKRVRAQIAALEAKR